MTQERKPANEYEDLYELEDDECERLCEEVKKVMRLVCKEELTEDETNTLRNIFKNTPITPHFDGNIFFTNVIKRNNIDALKVMVEFSDATKKQQTDMVIYAIYRRSHKIMKFLIDRYNINIEDCRHGSTTETFREAKEYLKEIGHFTDLDGHPDSERIVRDLCNILNMCGDKNIDVEMLAKAFEDCDIRIGFEFGMFPQCATKADNINALKFLLSRKKGFYIPALIETAKKHNSEECSKFLETCNEKA